MEGSEGSKLDYETGRIIQHDSIKSTFCAATDDVFLLYRRSALDLKLELEMALATEVAWSSHTRSAHWLTTYN